MFTSSFKKAINKSMSSNALLYSFHLYSMQPKNKRWYNIYLVFTADNKIIYSCHINKLFYNKFNELFKNTYEDTLAIPDSFLCAGSLTLRFIGLMKS